MPYGNLTRHPRELQPSAAHRPPPPPVAATTRPPAAMYRLDAPTASIDAAYQHLPRVTAQQEAVLCAIYARGPAGATDKETEADMGGLHESVSARRNELVAAGYVEPARDADGTRIRRATPTGATAGAWIPTPAGRAWVAAIRADRSAVA